MTPGYLSHQLETSLRNLGLETVDIYYLHNPETQLSEIPWDELHRRLAAAFEFLERSAAEGKLRYYGTATWDGYRLPASAPGHVSLERLVRLAREVGGEGHRFRFVQLPYNLGMIEAFTEWTQPIGNRSASVLQAAADLGLTVLSSASIQQGRLTRGLPASLGVVFAGLATDAQRAIQFARSTPGLTTALVGMKQLAHVEENLAVAAVPPATPEQFLRLFESG
jgi:aryl-alcohol dehydrogenase-like predicted oxidoreductase